MSFAYLHECFPDPTKTFVYREVVAMRALGMEPVVFSVREPSGEEKARMEAIDVPVRYLPEETELRRQIDAGRKDFSRRQRRALSHWRAQKGDSNRVFEALWLGRELRRLGIRHVHAHFAGLAARTAWLVRELWGIGYSFTGHADDIFSPEAKPISLEMLVRDARFIATETDYSRARLEREFTSARGKTFRVFNGIGVMEPGTLRGEARDATPRILSVGRLVEKKGFPDLLRAMVILRDRGVAFACDLVGGGPMENEIRTLTETLKLGECVALHGAQPQSVVRQFLGEARVFALAAQTEGDGGSDNLPTVIMEAMAAGLPVVSTRIAGIPEMIDDGQTGALVEARDVPALAEALQRYLQDATLAERHGEEGRRAVRKFQVTASAERLAELLVQCAGIIPPAPVVARYPAWRVSFLRRLLRTFGVGG